MALKLLSLIVAITFFSACSTSESNSTNKLVFFDTDAFFNAEQARLTKQQPKIAAQIGVKGINEQKNLDSLNYSDAFKLFFQSSINKPAWRNAQKYAIDSVREGNQLKKIIYTAVATNLKTKRLEIAFDAQQKPQNFIFDFVNASVLGDVTQKLEYDVTRGFKIYNKQSVIFMPASEVEMNYVFR